MSKDELIECSMCGKKECHCEETYNRGFKAGQESEAKKYNPTILKNKIDQARQEGFELAVDNAVATERKKILNWIDDNAIKKFESPLDELFIDATKDVFILTRKQLEELKSKLGCKKKKRKYDCDTCQYDKTCDKTRLRTFDEEGCGDWRKCHFEGCD